MSEIVIRAENLGKRYRLGVISGTTLREDMHRRWQIIRHKPNSSNCDNQYGAKGSNHWALRDVTFDVRQGEVVGLVGNNGAGKSTLLKILSRTTAPTGGIARLKGRIASLLEVGTGFHPELTGRENIFLNGAILGMSRAEVSRKIDGIVSFSGLEVFIDTPIKRYSSGMYVRLGFAVAAYLEPEILIVDEVLAVGDLDFQKRCLGKMKDLSSGGRTIIFVSHNMASIRALCSRAIWLDQGGIREDSDTATTVASYLESNQKQAAHPIASRLDRRGHGGARITRIAVASEDGSPVQSGSRVIFSLEYSATRRIRSPSIKIGIYDMQEHPVYGLDSAIFPDLPDFTPGCGLIECRTGSFNVTAGACVVNVALLEGTELVDHVPEALVFSVDASDFFGTGKAPDRSWTVGLIQQNWNWKALP